MKCREDCRMYYSEKDGYVIKAELKTEINCRKCFWMTYDGDWTGEEYEICQKKHELYPEECEDFTTYR